MNYSIELSQFFLEQFTKLDTKARRIIKEKIQLLKTNPFRYKRLKGFKFFLCRVRFESRRKEKRLIYLVDRNKVKILNITDRDKEYSDLRMYLKKLKVK